MTSSGKLLSSDKGEARALQTQSLTVQDSTLMHPVGENMVGGAEDTEKGLEIVNLTKRDMVPMKRGEKSAARRQRARVCLLNKAPDVPECS